MSALQLYSLRQLSPFQGLVHIASLPQVRAISNDGVFWQIQVSVENQQHKMGLQQPGLPRRFVLWGVWSKQFGLKSMPLDPMLDVPNDELVEQQLVPALAFSLQQLPFAPRDHYELWILDNQDNSPVALLATRTDAYSIEQIKTLHWKASTNSQRNFISARSHTTVEPLLKLERLIADHTCCPIRSQWFLRDTNGDGTGMTGQNLDKHLIDRILKKNQFPELLIRESWPHDDDRLLAEDYQNWLAPRLLTLHHLLPATRARLELAAQAYATETAQLLHLYPEIIDQKIINRILVEARLRAAASTTVLNL